MNRIKKTFEIETSPDVMERIERFLAMLHYNSCFGHSGIFAMPLDGDGSDKVVVNPKPGYKNGVDVVGGIGGNVEMANNGGFTSFDIKKLGSDWVVKDSATLYKNGEPHKTIPSTLNRG